MPEFDNIRILHGVMFVRRGLYRDGVFRFIIQLSKEYNCLNQHPVISFTPPVFHPLIHPEVCINNMFFSYSTIYLYLFTYIVFNPFYI